MGLTPDEVKRLAGLARIDLTDAELERLAPQLDIIVSSVERVAEIATPDVPATSHPLPLRNVFRPDVVTDSLGAEATLANAPATEDGRFRVPRILGESA